MKYYKLKVVDVVIYYRVHKNTFEYYINDPEGISTFSIPESNRWTRPAREWNFIVEHNKKNLKQITKKEVFIEIL